MPCNLQHTKYQPREDDYKCPKCEASKGKYCIDTPGDESECSKLHPDDVLACFKCGHTEKGLKFSLRAQRNRNMIKCPRCNGHGFIEDPMVKKGGRHA